MTIRLAYMTKRHASRACEKQGVIGLDFALRLKELRETAAMTQSKLASLAGMDPSAIAHLEGGRRKPSFHNIRKLAKALNITTDVLLDQSKPIMAFRNVQDLDEGDRKTVQSIINTLANKPKA